MAGVKGKLTGKIHNGHYHIFVMADDVDDQPLIYVDVVQVLYGEIESTMAGDAYRHTLGETLGEYTYEADVNAWNVALQADRTAAVGPKDNGIRHLPEVLQGYAWQALRSTTE